MKMGDLHLLSDLEDNNVLNILKIDTDLKDYSAKIESELKSVENQAISDYIKESGNIAALHDRMSESDHILERMENLLEEFQQSLSNISYEIVDLQSKSVQMTQELTNKQEVSIKLNQFIDEILISNDMIDIILQNSVTDPQFVQQLHILNDKLHFAKVQQFREIRASKEIIEMLDKVRLKVVSKIRHYLFEQVYKFRKPLSNYQMPQNILLKSRFLFEFLLSHERKMAHEICSEYVNTMTKIYFSYFKSYCGRLADLRFDEAPGKDDLMGFDENTNRGFFYKSALKHKGTVFTIGNRDEVLVQQLEAPIIVPHAQQKSQYQFEALFRSEQYALVDNACREYLFICEFFMVQGVQAQNLFDKIMEKSLTLLSKNLETFVHQTYDLFALFLSVHLVLRYQIMCHKRCVNALDQYWDKLQAIIWPRFEYLFRLNMQSIRDCDPSKFNKETGPHYITRRYAEFSAAIVGISENFPNDLINRLLAELQEEVDRFILRMANIFVPKKDYYVFLINNYDVILNILMERTKDTSKEAERFRERLTVRSSEFVEEILMKYFANLIQLLRNHENRPVANSGNVNSFESNLEVLVKHFSNSWQKSLESIHREILISFPNLVTGSILFQLSVTRLLDYYQKLQSMLPSNLKNQLINIHHIKIELKKYKTCY